MEPARGLLLPLAFALSLAALGALPAAGRHPPLVAAFLGAAASLVAWSAILLVTASRAGRRLGLHVVLRPQHYVQACAQLSIFVYWGWYWRDVYDAAPLIVAQLVFAYAFDLLFTWSRRDHYTLGFGPFPIIFSINLFMWFRPDWFYLQFLMVAVGFGVKELIRWNRDGRRVHIFNASHIGGGHLDHATVSTAYLPGDFSGQSAGAVPFRRRIDDVVRGHDNLRVHAAAHGG